MSLILKFTHDQLPGMNDEIISSLELFKADLPPTDFIHFNYKIYKDEPASIESISEVYSPRNTRALLNSSNQNLRFNIGQLSNIEDTVIDALQPLKDSLIEGYFIHVRIAIYTNKPENLVLRINKGDTHRTTALLYNNE